MNPTPVLIQIEKSAFNLSAVRNELKGVLAARQIQIEDADAKFLPRIRALARMLTGRIDELTTLVDENRAEFASPRTRVFHEIKVGLTKQRGSLEIPNEEATIAKIRKSYSPEFAEALLNVTTTPNKKALESLSPAELKKLGVEIAGATDAVIVKPMNGEVDKLVDSILKKAVSEALGEGAE